MSFSVHLQILRPTVIMNASGSVLPVRADLKEAATPGQPTRL